MSRASRLSKQIDSDSIGGLFGIEVTAKMNCEKCQELISDLLDGALSDMDHKTLDAHLEECLSCDSVRQELDAIVTYCRDHRGEYVAPPNERALWLRIRNSIENQRGGARALAATSSAGTGRVLIWLSGLFNRQWKLSLPQIAAAVLAVAIGVSLATALGLNRFQQNRNGGGSGKGDSSSFMPSVAFTRNIDDRLRVQEQVVDHWNKVIEQRKASWSARTREAFDRNLQVIDQSVSAYRDELRRNPYDEVSAEMLDAAMSDKMNLLSEFADL